MRYSNFSRKLLFVPFMALVSAWLLLVAGTALAITYGYASEDTELKPGMVVSLSQTDQQQSYVERATQDSASRVVGVATTTDESKVTVASAQSQVYVENEGEVAAYVSDINGAVKKGDLLVVSPFKGILAKATTASSLVVAVAAQDSTASSATQYPISGSTKTAGVEKLRVNLDRKGIDKKLADSQETPLGALGRTITGRQIQELRVLIALIIFFIVMLVEGAILYGSISSAIISLGRNPMARRFIIRELARVVAITFAVLFLGVGAIYAILWI